MCSPLPKQLNAAWLRPLRRHFSQRQTLFHGRTHIAPSYPTLLHSHHQLSLFATAFLPITTPPHLEVSDCGAIQQIVRRIRGWSRSRFYSPCLPGCPPLLPNSRFNRPGNTTRNPESQLSHLGRCSDLGGEDLTNSCKLCLVSYWKFWSLLHSNLPFGCVEELVDLEVHSTECDTVAIQKQNGCFLLC